MYIRVKANTAHSTNYFRMKVRVCGEEVIHLYNSAKKTYIYGIESESSSSRYLTFSQSTFRSWFYISPSNSDVCAIDHFEILSSVDPVTAWNTSDGRA